MLFDACSVPKMREFWLSLSTAKQILKFEFPSARPWTPISVPYCRARFSYHHIHHNSFPITKYLNLEASCSSIQRLCKRVHEMCTKRGVFGLGVFTLSKNSSPCPISYRQKVLPGWVWGFYFYSIELTFQPKAAMLFDVCSVPKMGEFWLSFSTAKQIFKI